MSSSYHMRQWNSFDHNDPYPLKKTKIIESSYEDMLSPCLHPFILSTDQIQWLTELGLAIEQECMSILYAKSLLHHSSFTLREDRIEEKKPRPLSISIGKRVDVIDSNGLPQVTPPPKPRRCIARLTSSRNDMNSSIPLHTRSTMNLSSTNGDEYKSCKMSPPSRRRLRLPSYDQLEKKWRLTHSINVNEEDEYNDKNDMDRDERKCLETSSMISIDSGLYSGEAVFSSFSSERESSECIALLRHNNMKSLPSYTRMASTMDHILRTSSSIFTLFNRSNSSSTISSKTIILIEMIQSSPLSSSISNEEVKIVRDMIMNSQGQQIPHNGLILIRKLVENILQLFSKIISIYLSEVSHKDRLLSVAIEHLIHICLFGDELCIHAIQNGCMDEIMKISRNKSIPSHTYKLIIRIIAVLCSTSKGSLQFLSLGGLPFLFNNLSSPSSSISIEASGLFTQLTNPSCSYIHIENMEPVVNRLLELIDNSTNCESLLLSSSALANISHVQSSLLYQKNAVRRLIDAYRRKNCSSIFVQEQLATIFSRLSARKYEEFLIAQGAVPVVLEMVTATDTQNTEYCRRIRYKAAVCIGTLAATGIGLKALYCNHAYAIVSNVLEMENSPSSTLNMICSNIKMKLEQKYQTESAV